LHMLPESVLNFLDATTRQAHCAGPIMQLHR
jgi:hypothetical protein